MRRMKMFRRMLVLRRIAAPHVPAEKAFPQMHPRVAHLQAFLASLRTRLHRLDLIHMTALCRHRHASRENLTLLPHALPVNLLRSRSLPILKIPPQNEMLRFLRRQGDPAMSVIRANKIAMILCMAAALLVSARPA